MQDCSNYCSLALSHRHAIRFLGCWWCSFYSRDENRYILFQVDYDCQIQQTTWVMPDIDLKLIHVIGAALNLTQSQSYDFKTFVHTWMFLIWSRLVIRIRDNVIKWKHFPRYSPFVWEIHRSPVDSPHKGQWRGALMFSWSCFTDDIVFHSWSAPEQTVEQTIKTTVIWDAIALIMTSP